MRPPKRPRDPNQLAKTIVDIATGEEKDAGFGLEVQQSIVQQGAVEGGYARAISLSPERRSEISRAAAQARWKNN